MKELVRQLVADVLGMDPGEVSDELSRDTADNWDSLNHLRIVTAIEQEFALSLSMDDIQEARDVSDLAELVTRAKGGQ
jgi:acyl carrier protein